jgi:hypothetical protein
VLNLLEKDKESPFFLAVINQFDAINLDIENDKFSKTYIDVAINTKKMITAKSTGERNHCAAKHVAITTKESVGKIVGGCMLMLVGIAITVGSGLLASYFMPTGGFIALMGSAIGIGSGIALGAVGISNIKSVDFVA